MFKKMLLTSLFIISLLTLASWGGGQLPDDEVFQDFSKTETSCSLEQFYIDARNFKEKNVATLTSPEVIIPLKPKLRDSVPLWVRKGQLMKESSSYYTEDGVIKYVNKKRGGNNNKKKGAIGPYQVLRCSFNHMKKKNPDILNGVKYEEMQKNTALNEEVACLYLLYIYHNRANKNWDMTVMLYNRGPWGDVDDDARYYLKMVKFFGVE